MRGLNLLIIGRAFLANADAKPIGREHGEIACAILLAKVENMNALAKIEPMVPLDLGRSTKTLSLPEWLLRSVSGLTVGSEAVTREDGVQARRPIPTIYRSLAPSKAQCAAIEVRLAELRAALGQTNVDYSMAKVTELLLSFPSQAVNEAGAKAKARGYIIALDDLPSWAVADACRKWLRGECGEQNYNFAPSPPQLRKFAEKSARLVSDQIKILEKLIAAQIVDDPEQFSDEHCQEMLGRLSELFRFGKNNEQQSHA